jgi:hypothetical protein
MIEGPFRRATQTILIMMLERKMKEVMPPISFDAVDPEPNELAEGTPLTRGALQAHPIAARIVPIERPLGAILPQHLPLSPLAIH